MGNEQRSGLSFKKKAGLAVATGLTAAAGSMALSSENNAQTVSESPRNLPLAIERQLSQENTPLRIITQSMLYENPQEKILRRQLFDGRFDVFQEEVSTENGTFYELRGIDIKTGQSFDIATQEGTTNIAGNISNGELVYVSGNGTTTDTLHVFNLEAKTDQIVSTKVDKVSKREPYIDGGRITFIYHVENGYPEVYVLDRTTGQERPFSTPTATDKRKPILNKDTIAWIGKKDGRDKVDVFNVQTGARIDEIASPTNNVSEFCLKDGITLDYIESPTFSPITRTWLYEKKYPTGQVEELDRVVYEIKSNLSATKDYLAYQAQQFNSSESRVKVHDYVNKDSFQVSFGIDHASFPSAFQKPNTTGEVEVTYVDKKPNDPDSKSKIRKARQSTVDKSQFIPLAIKK